MMRLGKGWNRVLAFALGMVMTAGYAMSAYALEDGAAAEATAQIAAAQEAAQTLEIAGDVVAKLAETTTAVNNTAEQLEAATAAVEAAVTADAEAQAEEAAFVDYEAGLDTFQTEATAASQAAGAAVTDAQIANTTNDREAADAAKANAESAYEQAVTGFETAAEELSAANDRYDAATTALETAEQKMADAADKMQAAETALSQAETESAAAEEAMAQAQQLMATLEEQKADLESIHAQYYALMTTYFDDIKCAVYDEEGNLDLAASAAKAEGNSQVEAKAKNPNGNVMQLGRNLMEQLIHFMLTYEKQASDLTIAQTYTAGNGVRKVNKDAKQVGADKYTQVWANVDGQSGRNNHVEAVYTDENGTVQVEYYNYIFKSAVYGDDVELTSGPVYLAVVSLNEEGQWENVHVDADSNYDDYNKLVKVVTALENYENAKAAVNAAQNKVNALKAQVEAFSTGAVRDTQALYAQAVADLAAAKEQLDAAQAQKEQLEAAVQDAKKAVESIDLSRFNVTDNSNVKIVVTNNAAVAPVAEEAEEVAEEIENTPAAQTVTATTATAPAAATVAAEEVVEIIEEEVPMADAVASPAQEAEDEDAEAEEETVQVLEADSAHGIASADNVVEMEDDAVALADSAATAGQRTFWWIWLVILGAACLAYSLYYNKKAEDIE